MMMSMGSDGIEGSSAKPNIHNIDDYVPDLGGQTRYHNWFRCEFINDISQFVQCRKDRRWKPVDSRRAKRVLVMEKRVQCSSSRAP